MLQQQQYAGVALPGCRVAASQESGLVPRPMVRAIACCFQTNLCGKMVGVMLTRKTPSLALHDGASIAISHPSHAMSAAKVPLVHVAVVFC